METLNVFVCSSLTISYVIFNALVATTFATNTNNVVESYTNVTTTPSEISTERVFLNHYANVIENDDDADINQFIETLVQIANLQVNGAGNLLNQVINSPLLNNCFNFTCPSQSKPAPNPLHISMPNGCGAYGIIFDFNILKMIGFNDCCNQHDQCYSTCNADKHQCDRQFKQCLYNNCEFMRTQYKIDLVYLFVNMLTWETAKGMYLLVQKLGCVAFYQSQQLACKCE